MDDIEAAGASSHNKQHEKRLESHRKGMVWCQICMIEVNKDAYHCEDCDVCIEDYDHHCVFFSKCIGGGNLACFWGSLGGVLFNFFNIAIMLAVTSIYMGGLDTGRKVPTQPFEPVANAATDVMKEILT